LKGCLILPGVGALLEAMNNLKKLGLDTAIKDKVNRMGPYLEFV
jgi:imidazoleglycerol phosphate synthase glutamine amidotransferase subunit HisH